MANGRIKKVSRQEPCPICGKPDYCFWKERNDDPGRYNLYCNRSSEAPGVIASGIDGKEYVALHEGDGRTIYEEKEQREQRWKEEISGERKEVKPRSFTVLDSIEPLPDEQLHAIYSAILAELPLYRHHAEYLFKEGWSWELIEKYHIRSFPVKNPQSLPPSLRYIPDRETIAKKVMEKLNLKSLAGGPGAYLSDKGRWTFHSMSGIALPVLNMDGKIVRLRIRMDYLDLPVKLQEDKDGFFYMDGSERITVSMSGPFKMADGQKIFMDFNSHKGKYRNFSSYKEDDAMYQDGYICNVYNKGCEAKNALTCVMDPTDNYNAVWIIEGEKKAIYSHEVIRQPFIGLSGVNDYARLEKKVRGISPLEAMRNRGVKIAILAYDADRYHNAQVMLHMNGLAKMMLSHGFKVYIADWDEKDGKGLDDLLSGHKIPMFYEYQNA